MAGDGPGGLCNGIGGRPIGLHMTASWYAEPVIFDGVLLLIGVTMQPLEVEVNISYRVSLGVCVITAARDTYKCDLCLLRLSSSLRNYYVNTLPCSH
jgi:hypothetical protein